MLNEINFKEGRSDGMARKSGVISYIKRNGGITGLK